MSSIMTILEYCGKSELGRCGYCHNTRGSKGSVKTENNGECETEAVNDDEDDDKGGSNTLGGAWAHRLTNDNYMELLDMGWRRSGKYLYKPANETTCCPQYTIRLDVNKFYMARSQRRAMRQMNEFLATGKKPRSAVVNEDKVDKNEEGGSDNVDGGMETGESSSTMNGAVMVDEALTTSKEKSVKKEKEDRPVLKKKEIRRKRFEEKCARKGLDCVEERRKRAEKEEARRRTVESYILEHRDSWKHKLKVKIVATSSEEFRSRDDESFELYKKYQMTIHKDKECRLAGYRRFLTEAPLEEETDETGRIDIGPFHVWFLLDDKLIAVSVVDVLPRCLSAKYMFYDPDYSFLSLGTYTALREIVLTREYANINSELRYYYMGFYIDTCPKMRYKAKFRPSDLLCDKSFKWLDYESCKPLFASSTYPNGYTVFRPDEEAPIPPSIDRILVIADRACRPYEAYLRSKNLTEGPADFVEKFEQFAAAIGPKLESVAIYFEELNKST